MWVSCVADAASPWSNCACARRGTLPFSVVSDNSSTFAAIRGVAVECWAINAVEQSNAPANTLRENAFIKRIVVFLDPSLGLNPRPNNKLQLHWNHTVNNRLPALQSGDWMRESR